MSNMHSKPGYSSRSDAAVTPAAKAPVPARVHESSSSSQNQQCPIQVLGRNKMHHIKSSLRSSLPVVLAATFAATLAGCLSQAQEAGGRPKSARLTLADAWADAIFDMGMFPVFPPTEDVYVGDMFAFSSPPSFESVETADGLRTAATPRWKSLQVLTRLEDEYRRRPTWGPSPDVRGVAEPDAATQSLYRADRIPTRHRIVGLRSMLKVTLDVPDLEPFIPIEIAPLFDGPATPDRLGVSVQAGDAETYSLSVEALIDELLDVTVGPAGTTFTLKQEHLHNLPLVADPKTGRVYLVVLSEVLYIRSIEASVRRRDARYDEVSTDGQFGQVEPEIPESGLLQTGGEPDEDRAIAAIRRATEMNEALGYSGLEEHKIGGTIEIVMVTNDGITLRRTWPYPLAAAVRGILLEVDASTGNVSRMGPLGVELPNLPPPEPDPQPAASDPAPDPVPDEEQSPRN